MNLDCTRCDELLLDHAYGELDEVTDAALQKHVDGCARCTAAMADVSIVRDACRAIEMPEPPLALDAAILAAAATAARAPQKVAARTIAVDRPVSIVTRLFESFASMAMKPQMAMAAVLVVVVGVALLVGQDARMPADEAVPSEGLRAPAAPALEPPPSESVALAPVPPAVSVPVVPREPAVPNQEPALRRLDEEEAQTGGEGLRGRRSATRDEAPADDAFGTEDRRAREEDVSRSEAPARRVAEGGGTITKSAPQPGPVGSGSSGGFAPPNAQARAATPQAAPPTGGDFADSSATEQERADANGGRPAFESGIGNYNRNRYGDAADDLGQFIARPGDATSLLPTARITRARSLKNIGRCGEAVREYEEYLRRWGSGSNGAEARVEAADCYSRLGQTTRAQELYAQAENQSGASASTRARARRSRVSLEAVESTSPAAEPPAAAAPADADQSF